MFVIKVYYLVRRFETIGLWIRQTYRRRNAADITPQFLGVLSKAVAKSARLMAEDLCREVGFILPQRANTKEILNSLKCIPIVPPMWWYTC